MNLSQINRMALYQADKVKQAGTATTFCTQYELDTWTNDANRECERLVRLANPEADYFDKIYNSSTGTTALKLNGISYTPSTSLNLAVSTSRFSLPPDFLKLRSIRCVTSGYESMTFEHMDITNPQFQFQLKRTDTVSPDGVFYDIIGDRTLWIAPQLSTAVDIELVCVARTRPLVQYSTGTVAVTTATTAVVGVGSTWVGSGTQFDEDYLDIMWGTSASATLPVTYPNLNYDDVLLSRVVTILTDTTLTLATAKSGTLAAGTGYVLASLPTLPLEFHNALIDYVTSMILNKAHDYKQAANYMGQFSRRVAGLCSSASRRQDADAETVEDWDAE